MRTPIWLSSTVFALALAACASHQGPAPSAAAPAPPPPAAEAAPAPSGNVAAPGVSIAPPEPPPPPGDVVVPGRERPITPPGDPRTVSERVSDIHAWDQCVTRAQAMTETDPTRPQLESPEELCRRTLGMADRNAVPQSRLQHH